MAVFHGLLSDCQATAVSTVKPPFEQLPHMLLEALRGVKQKVTGGWVTAFLLLAASTSVVQHTSGGERKKKKKTSRKCRVESDANIVVNYRVE